MINYDYLVTGETTHIRENGATSGAGVLATFGYDQLGRRSSLTRGNGTVTSYGYDAASWLEALGQDLGGSANDLSLTFGHNPAGQIVENVRANSVYSFAPLLENVTDTHNALNQIVASGGTAVTHDGGGNMVKDGPNDALFKYDPPIRLQRRVPRKVERAAVLGSLMRR